jgi:ABC-2 type transport system permease protein
MSSAANTVSATQPVNHSTQPFAWSVRREIWEHRSVWIAPLAAAGLVLFSFLFRLAKLPSLVDKANHLAPMPRVVAIALPFAIATSAIIVTGTIVSFFFCLGALNNERRDRSILFWKSLPVSDTTAVLAKAFVPLVLVPLIVIVTAVVTQLIMLLVATIVLTATGANVSQIWTGWPLAQFEMTMLYVLVTGVLWYAPIYGWVLMISSWARRVAFLWAVLPWLGLFLLEQMAFGTDYVGSFIDDRINGSLKVAFNLPSGNHHVNFSTMPVIDPLHFMTPGHFFASPSLWLGLIATAIFIAAAIWFRRVGDPG